MATSYFLWRQGNLVIRYDKVLQLQKLLSECNPEPLQCYLWAVNCDSLPVEDFTSVAAPRLRRLSAEILKILLHGPQLPAVEEPILQQLRQEGLAEIHRHLNGTILPSLLWVYLIQAPQRLSAQRIAGNLDGLNEHDCIALLRTARDLRAALLKRLVNGNNYYKEKSDEKEKWDEDVIQRLAAAYNYLPIQFQNRRTFQLSGLPDYRDPAALLPLGEDEPMVTERLFLLRIFELFHKEAEDAVLAAALHAYLLIQNLIWRALVQPRDTAKGFDRFDRYQALFLRRPEKDIAFSLGRHRYLHRLIQAQRTGGVRWMELRTTAFDGVWQETRRLEHALRDILKEDIANHQREIRQVLSESGGDNPLPGWFATPGQQEYRLNRILDQIHASRLQARLIFHFIKQADTLKLQEHDEIIPCRHSRLRRQVWKQAIDIQKVHRSRHYGGYIVGLDAANSELKARPEVFAPAIRWLRNIPCQPPDSAYGMLIRRFDPDEPRSFGLTFHVGEDFRHLLSGLRAVDEALRFLDMGPGDRIGHGLALGLSYKTWCESIGGEVAMPWGERLDDLVWLREQLAKEPGLFGRLLVAIDDEIRRLAWELYSPFINALEHGSVNWKLHRDWELLQLALVDWQHLHSAWAYRYQDPLNLGKLDKLLMVEPAAENSPYKQVQQLLWQLYHFNPGVRARYESPLRVLLENSDLDHWHKAVTWVQDKLLTEIRDKRIAIEINPTSNLCIGPLQKMTEHPVFRWHPPKGTDAAIRPAILVGSDDPGVFGTELVFEYAVLARAAEEQGATLREIECWLRDLRDTSKTFCFLKAV